MGNRRRIKIFAIFFLALLFINVQACHTMKFVIEDAQYENVVEDTNWFFIEGLFPTRAIDVSLKCPAGVTAIKEQTTAGNVAVSILSLGIATPRNSWYYCLPEKDLDKKISQPLKEKSL